VRGDTGDETPGCPLSSVRTRWKIGRLGGVNVIPRLPVQLDDQSVGHAVFNIARIEGNTGSDTIAAARATA
jgi:hypothetical protein